MGLLGLSLIFASVVFLCLRPPAWLPGYWKNFQQPRLDAPPKRGLIDQPRESDSPDDKEDGIQLGEREPAAGMSTGIAVTDAAFTRSEHDRLAMPPPPPPVIKRVVAGRRSSHGGDDEEQTTPKATAVRRADPVPSFSLSASDSDTAPTSTGIPTFAVPDAPQPQTTAAGLMAPPPRPPRLKPVASPSRLSAPSRGLPIPNRGPLAGSSLALPPTHSAKPQKPSKQVVLTPGHSPLDWARLSSDPRSDLRGLAPNSPYLRVTPSMLKRMTGRKGKDAWTVLGGRVYNMTPYMPFHPGGEPELLRGAGRDGTKLFGEVHPWVNYEGMLAACLVGIYVPEEDAASNGNMDEMD